MLLAAAALIKDAARTSFDDRRRGGRRRRLQAATARRRSTAAPVAIKNIGTDTLDAVIDTDRRPVVPEPAGGDGFTIERELLHARRRADRHRDDRPERPHRRRAHGHRRPGAGAASILVVDPIPAGFEIENPNISASGEVIDFGWLDVDRNAAHTEARTDRFVAALDRDAATTRSSSASPTRCARSRRAPSPSRRRRSRTCTVPT